MYCLRKGKLLTKNSHLYCLLPIFRVQYKLRFVKSFLQALHKSHSRDHVSWHFMDELRNLITDPSQCPECSYTGDKLEAVSRHLALYHCKLDEFLKDPELVAAKRAKAMAKPKKVTHCDLFAYRYCWVAYADRFRPKTKVQNLVYFFRSKKVGLP